MGSAYRHQLWLSIQHHAASPGARGVGKRERGARLRRERLRTSTAARQNRTRWFPEPTQARTGSAIRIVVRRERRDDGRGHGEGPKMPPDPSTEMIKAAVADAEPGVVPAAKALAPELLPVGTPGPLAPWLRAPPRTTARRREHRRGRRCSRSCAMRLSQRMGRAHSRSRLPVPPDAAGSSSGPRGQDQADRGVDQRGVSMTP